MKKCEGCEKMCAAWCEVWANRFVCFSCTEDNAITSRTPDENAKRIAEHARQSHKAKTAVARWMR